MSVTSTSTFMGQRFQEAESQSKCLLLKFIVCRSRSGNLDPEVGGVRRSLFRDFLARL